MGMFDYIRCKRTLPGVFPAAFSLAFQTKSLVCFMDNYEIHEDGSLWCERYDARFEEKPEEIFGGIVYQDNKRWEQVFLSGEVRFYCWQSIEDHLEFLAFYWQGELRELYCVTAIGPMAMPIQPVAALSLARSGEDMSQQTAI